MNLKQGLLYLIAFGPGYGESIVLRVPDHDPRWIVIDGCRMSSLRHPQSPAAQLLQEHGATWDAVIFTHPHQDHASGLDDVLELQSPGEGLIGCFPYSPGSLGPQGTTDPVREFAGDATQHVLATIQDRWEQQPETKWELSRGEQRKIGSLELTALHPDEDARQQALQTQQPNRLSTALLAQWEECRLLLGADVEACDWASIAQAYPGLGNHHGLKYPHHGALGAFHNSYARGDPERLWLITPYNKGCKLPKADQNEGLHYALDHVGALYLTGLPFPHAQQLQAAPREIDRQSLQQELAGGGSTRPLPGGWSFTPQPRAEGLSCYIAAGFDSQGVMRDLQGGPGTVRVHP